MRGTHFLAQSGASCVPRTTVLVIYTPVERVAMTKLALNLPLETPGCRFGTIKVQLFINIRAQSFSRTQLRRAAGRNVLLQHDKQTLRHVRF